jgi:hypothetical protein
MGASKHALRAVGTDKATYLDSDQFTDVCENVLISNSRPNTAVEGERAAYYDVMDVPTAVRQAVGPAYSVSSKTIKQAMDGKTVETPEQLKEVTKAAIALHVVDYFSTPQDLEKSDEPVLTARTATAPEEPPKAAVDSKAVLSEYDWYFSAPKWKDDDEED